MLSSFGLIDFGIFAWSRPAVAARASVFAWTPAASQVLAVLRALLLVSVFDVARALVQGNVEFGDSYSGQPPLPGRLLIPLDSVYILLNLGIHGLVRHID